MEKSNDTCVENEDRKLEIESNLQKLIEKRNKLKETGQLVDDMATLLNRGIIVNMLDLANIKNEGAVINLLRVYNDTMNNSEFMKYNPDDEEVFGFVENSKESFSIIHIDSLLQAEHCDFEGKIDNNCFVSRKSDGNIQFVSGRNAKNGKIAENVQTYLFNNEGLLIHEVSDYNISKNNSTLFDSMRVRESISYNNDSYQIVDNLYYGDNNVFYSIIGDFKELNSEKIIKTKNEIKKYEKIFERTFPKTLKTFSGFRQMLIDNHLEKIYLENFSELYNNVKLSESKEEEKSGPRL